MITLSEYVYILEWQDGDITIENINDGIMLGIDEQKALYEYLKARFEDSSDQKEN